MASMRATIIWSSYHTYLVLALSLLTISLQRATYETMRFHAYYKIPSCVRLQIPPRPRALQNLAPMFCLLADGRELAAWRASAPAAP
eukprot:6183599-Pleurochrysis_carterae.AAC.1